MSSLTLNVETQFAEIFEFSGIIENVKRSKLIARKKLGEFGLSVAMPIAFSTGTIKLISNKKHIDRFFDKVFNDFQEMSPRERMKFEARLVNSFQELESNLTPLLFTIESRNHLGSHMFTKEAKLILDLIKEKNQLFTDLVYPNRVDPASDPTRFKELVEAYKGVDLSDWKAEEQSKSKAHFVKHG